MVKKSNGEILALIPARSGSKRIPNKNIIKIGEYPLVAYSIVAAQISSLISRIIVTTDNQKIANISSKYGAEVPFLRPKEISQDTSLDIEFFEHALNWLKENENYKPDLVIHLRPTTPFRNSKVIDKAIKTLIEDKNATSLRSGHVAEETPYKLFTVEDGYCKFFGRNEFKPKEEYYNYPRQRFPDAYIPNGYVDIIKPEVLKKTGSLHGEKIHAFITNKIPDIDNFDDLSYARKIINSVEYRSLLEKLDEYK
jgi:CMP-N-acetylneuraminic acid synthetase